MSGPAAAARGRTLGCWGSGWGVHPTPTRGPARAFVLGIRPGWGRRGAAKGMPDQGVGDRDGDVREVGRGRPQARQVLGRGATRPRSRREGAAAGPGGGQGLPGMPRRAPPPEQPPGDGARRPAGEALRRGLSPRGAGRRRPWAAGAPTRGLG